MDCYQGGKDNEQLPKMHNSRTFARVATAASTAIAAVCLSAAAHAATVVIDFSGTSNGQNVSTLYAPLGVTFSNATASTCGGGCPAPTPFGYFASNSGNAFTAFFAAPQSLISFQTVSFSSTLAQAFSAGNVLLSQAGENNGFPVTNAVLSLSGPGIAYVKFLSNGGVNGPTLTNLSFNALGAVPEPSAWLMMITGFAVVGAAMRRQQRLRVRYA